MKNALSFFLMLLMVMVILKIFAPGVAEQLIEIMSKVLTLVNRSLDTMLQQQPSGEAVSLLATWLA